MQSPQSINNNRYFSGWDDSNKENWDPNNGRNHYQPKGNGGPGNGHPPFGCLDNNRLRQNYSELVTIASCKHVKAHDEFELKMLEDRHEEQRRKLSRRQSSEISKFKLDCNIRQALRNAELRIECAQNLKHMTDSELLMDLCTRSDRFYMPESPAYTPTDAFDAV